MKQYITVKQLNELSYKGKMKLREWCRKRNYWVINFSMTQKDGSTEKVGPTLLSIGQMIEFLVDNDGYSIPHIFASNISDHWTDCLWDACRKVLDEKKD